MNICNKIESLQYNAALALTGAIRGSSKEKLYQELGFKFKKMIKEALSILENYCE